MTTDWTTQAGWNSIRDNQDDCLIAIEDGHPLPTRKLLALPPWRAVLMARVAARAGVPLEQGTVDQLIAEARSVGGDSRLGNWWERTTSDHRRPEPLHANLQPRQLRHGAAGEPPAP